ncbi:hypothetical protein Lser_V15G44347 [Lactuca serriola]
MNILQSKEAIFIIQEMCSRNLLEKFGMTNSSKSKIPMAVGTRLGPSLDKHTVDLTLYRSMIGSLLNLISSRQDIMFVVCNCSMYQSNPREPHLIGVKNIFRYLKGTTSLGLWYPLKTGFFLQAFSDADLSECQLDRQRTTGGCQLLDEKLVSWPSKKQTCVSISITKVEYVAAAACPSQVIWIQIQLHDHAINMKKIHF